MPDKLLKAIVADSVAKPIDPRVSKINNAWMDAREKALKVLKVRWAARWAIAANLHLVHPHKVDAPTNGEVILFTRQKDEVWGSLHGLRLMVEKGVTWA